MIFTRAINASRCWIRKRESSWSGDWSTKTERCVPFTPACRNPSLRFFKGGVLGLISHAQKVETPVGQCHLHFTTCSCYGRLPLLRSVGGRNVFVKIPDEVRDRRCFFLMCY